MTDEPTTLDPHFSQQTEAYEGLVAPGPQGVLEPGVAESWTVSPDGLRSAKQ
jgi:ABC-type transport system substrate-binding protein